MPLSSSTLSAIQKAGAAVFAADVKLKNAVQEYAERVNAAIAKNPYSLGNDALFENWKIVARLSQTLVGIEEELKKVHRVASELTADDQPTVQDVPALAAPTRSTRQGAASPIDLMATAVKVKAKKKTSKSMARAASAGFVESRVANPQDLAPTDVVAKTKKKTPSPKAKVKSSKPARAPKVKRELGGNPAKLFQHLERVLNANEFTEISQTAVGQETGIPIGSMTAATKKLIEQGRIMVGPQGGYKLANPQQS